MPCSKSLLPFEARFSRFFEGIFLLMMTSSYLDLQCYKFLMEGFFMRRHNFRPAARGIAQEVGLFDIKGCRRGTSSLTTVNIDTRTILDCHPFQDVPHLPGACLFGSTSIQGKPAAHPWISRCWSFRACPVQGSLTGSGLRQKSGQRLRDQGDE